MPGGRPRPKPGKAYSNRTDLNKPVPMKSAPGQQYGAAKAQMDAQRAVPMAGAPQQQPPPQPVAPGSVGLPMPGSMPGLFDDSNDPDEHVMNGAPIGPGLGPEAFGVGPEAQDTRDDEWLRRNLPAMEFTANFGKGDDASRQIIRLLKARITF